MATEDAMTMADIEAAFAGEWVLIAEPKVGADGVLSGGRVAWHGPGHGETWRKGLQARFPKAALVQVPVRRE
ncbi:MAG: hypothetical protein HYX53_11215 [Chloroflexi bacterium]|nr:hypothetical protein [Chloroflexota bacterium]